MTTFKVADEVLLTSDRYAGYRACQGDRGVVQYIHHDNQFIDVMFSDRTLTVEQHHITAAEEKSPVGGTKHDTDKIRMELLPPFSLKEIAKVLTFGAKKYDSWNWTKGFDYSRLIGACERHLADWKSGIDKDPETGLSHLAHLGCCVLFLIWMEKHRPDLDDRFKDPAPTKKTT